MKEKIVGPIRFRFIHKELEVEVVLEGDSEWVGELRTEFGLDDVGWVQPLPKSMFGKDKPVESGKEEVKKKTKLPGPPPDPSKIPVVRRPIGSMNLEEELGEFCMEKKDLPSGAELAEIVEDMGKVEAVLGPLIKDPIAEAWVRRLLKVAVEEYGISNLPLSTIDIAIGDQIEYHDVGLEIWLEELFRQGKLTKVYGGEEIGFGPSPQWLAMVPPKEKEDVEIPPSGSPESIQHDQSSEGSTNQLK